MKIKKWKEINQKEKGIILFTILLVLLIIGVFFYQSFAVFQVNQNQNLIEGNVENLEDIYFSFYYDGKIQKEMPQNNQDYIFDPEQSYCGVLGEKDPTLKLEFDPDEGIHIEGKIKSHTKCKISFKKAEKLINKIKNLKVQTKNSGASGIYEVHHETANITYPEEDATQLKKTELRYAGANAENYVNLDGNLYRIIGLVNTLEGQRIKLVANDSIGAYSWDSSDSVMNKGNGVNEWSESDIMFELNYIYLNSQSGMCKRESNNQKALCNFEQLGLEKSKKFIDTITWNTATKIWDSNEEKVDRVYELERSNTTYSCKENNEFCNDTIQRTYTWQGKIALMYASDVIYSIAGDTNVTQEICFQSDKARINATCKNTSYLYQEKINSEWILNPYMYDNNASFAIAIYYKSNDGISVSAGRISASLGIRPCFYLKENIYVVSGNGSLSSPYILSNAF